MNRGINEENVLAMTLFRSATRLCSAETLLKATGMRDVSICIQPKTKELGYANQNIWTDVPMVLHGGGETILPILNSRAPIVV
jgi:hypothetical protein